MLVDVVDARPITGYKIYLKFEDNTEGEIDISQFIMFKGIFAKLQELEYFQNFRVNADLGTICWENGADISPEFLYAKIRG